MVAECALDATMPGYGWETPMQSILYEGQEILFIPFKKSGFLS